jgi:DNA polymerase III alpha subunit
MSDGFVNLHVHSERSLLDGMIKVDDLVKTTLEYNQVASVITDHGNMYTTVDHFKEAKKQGQHAIAGVELYMVQDMHNKGGSEGEAESVSKRNHFLLLAKNKAGYQKLCRIVSKGYTDGFYYRPRVDNTVFEEILDKDGKENDVIASSACFIAGTKVVLADGTLKNIEECVKGDKVITHLGTVEEVKAPTKRSFKGQIFKLKIKDKPDIRCTSDHKFFVQRFKNAVLSDNGKKELKCVWAEAKTLKRKDYMLEPVSNSEEADIEFEGVYYKRHQFLHYERKYYKEITVHCLAVENTHSFLVEGGISAHNCLAGIIPQYILNNEIEKADEVAKYYQHLFGGNFWLEIQPMEGYEQYVVNKEIIAMSKRLNIPIIATTDAHYLKKEDKATHDVLLCLQSSSLISDPNRWSFAGNSYYIMTKDEITDYFKRGYHYKLVKTRNTKKNATSEFKLTYVHDYDGAKFEAPDKVMNNFVEVVEEGYFSYADLDQDAIAQAIAETERVAQMCDFEIELGKHYLPKIKLPTDDPKFVNWRNKSKNKGKLNEDYLRYLCIGGLIKHGLTDKQYKDRLKYELKIINDMDFPDYFLIYYDIAKFCYDKNIPFGPGRGCFVANSMVKTDTDTVPIQDIEIGSNVYCHDELLHPVVAKHEYDIDEDITDIVCGDKAIKGVTLDHKIYAIKQEDFDKGVREPKWYHAKELKKGDYICEL